MFPTCLPCHPAIWIFTSFLRFLWLPVWGCFSPLSHTVLLKSFSWIVMDGLKCKQAPAVRAQRRKPIKFKSFQILGEGCPCAAGVPVIFTREWSHEDICLKSLAGRIYLEDMWDTSSNHKEWKQMWTKYNWVLINTVWERYPEKTGHLKETQQEKKNLIGT